MGFGLRARSEARPAALGVGSPSRLAKWLRYAIVHLGADVIAANLRGSRRQFKITAVMKARVQRERHYKGVDDQPNTHGMNAIS